MKIFIVSLLLALSAFSLNAQMQGAACHIAGQLCCSSSQSLAAPFDNRRLGCYNWRLEFNMVGNNADVANGEILGYPSDCAGAACGSTFTCAGINGTTNPSPSSPSSLTNLFGVVQVHCNMSYVQLVFTNGLNQTVNYNLWGANAISPLGLLHIFDAWKKALYATLLH